MRDRALTAAGNRTGARHGAAMSGRALAILLSLVLVGGCSANPATGSPTPGLGSPAPDASGAVPLATHWPTTVVEAIIGLAGADSQFPRIGKDLQDAINADDFRGLMSALPGILTFLTENQKQVPELQAYPATKALGDGLATSYAQMIAGITQIQDSLAASNGPGVTSGFTAFVAGNNAYAAQRSTLGTLGTQAVEMKRRFNL
jgi:hypothetical protein